MIIKVTQEHIENGCKKACLFCPVALALEARTGKEWSVGIYDAYCTHKSDDGPTLHTLPDSAKDFILYFDSGLPVEPFEFELEI